MIRTVQAADATAISDIYNYYINHTVVTFEEEQITGDDMLARINDVSSKYPWLVYEVNGEVIGYAYAGPWKARAAYRHSAECSVYLRHGDGGRGIGSALYEALFGMLKSTDIHALIGGIALPNEGSVALHEKFGFEKIAHFKEVGFKFNQWVDVGYWEKII